MNMQVGWPCAGSIRPRRTGLLEAVGRWPRLLPRLRPGGGLGGRAEHFDAAPRAGDAPAASSK